MKYEMKFRPSMIMALSAGALSLGLLAGCVDDEEGADITHETVHEALKMNARAVVDDLEASVVYLRDNVGFGVGEELTQVEQGLDEECDEFDEFEWCDEEDPIALEDGIDESVSELVDILQTQVLTEENIEEESDAKITYLMRGETTCEQEQDDYDECVEEFDAMQLRLVVSSPAEGDLDISVLIGPERFNPLDVELHQGFVAAQVDLGQIAQTVQYASDTIGEEEFEGLPETFEGRVRAELTHSSTELIATLSVLDKIKLGGNGWDFALEAAVPAAQLKIDAAADAIDVLVGFNALDFVIPVVDAYTEYDEETQTDIDRLHEYDFAGQIAGLTAQIAYQVDQQVVDIKNLGLGQSTSTLDVDGKRVVELDVNAEDNRQLNATITESEAGVEIAVEPTLDLELLLAFGQVQDVLEEFKQWTHDELLRINLGGADKPRILIADDEVEVLEGELNISSEGAGLNLSVEAGQCVFEDVENEEWDEEDYHPLQGFEAGVCGA